MRLQEIFHLRISDLWDLGIYILSRFLALIVRNLLFSLIRAIPRCYLTIISRRWYLSWGGGGRGLLSARHCWWGASRWRPRRAWCLSNLSILSPGVLWMWHKLCVSLFSIYRVFRNFFFYNSLQPLPRLHLPKTFKAINAMRVYSRSYWLAIFSTTNSSRVLARERWQTFENSWKKHNI